jgi:hypothetical protein
MKEKNELYEKIKLEEKIFSSFVFKAKNSCVGVSKTLFIDVNLENEENIKLLKECNEKDICFDIIGASPRILVSINDTAIGCIWSSKEAKESYTKVQTKHIDIDSDKEGSDEKH